MAQHMLVRLTVLVPMLAGQSQRHHITGLRQLGVGHPGPFLQQQQNQKLMRYGVQRVVLSCAAEGAALNPGCRPAQRPEYRSSHPGAHTLLAA